MSPLAQQFETQLVAATTAQQLLHVAEAVAGSLRALVHEPPMVDGRIVPRAEADAIAAELRELLVRALDLVARHSPSSANKFAWSWAWCEKKLQVPLTQRYPMPAMDEGRLEWPQRPSTSRANVERVARRDFPRADHPTVFALLAAYEGPEADRTRLVACRMARGKLSALRDALDRASNDYREVLGPGEYPTCYGRPDFHELPLEERQRLINADWSDFNAWLTAEAPAQESKPLMLGKAHGVLQQLAKAQEAIDSHDSEFSLPPYEGYEAAQRELHQLESGERAKLAEGLTDPSSAVRVEAAKALAYFSFKEARPELERGLADPVQNVRDACAEALAKVAPASAFSTIIEHGAAVSTDVLSRCANAAVKALGAKALPWVVKSGLSPRDGKNAWAALYSLDREGTSKALERGLTMDDVSWEWVHGVSQLVCERGGAWARPAFSALARHPDKRYQDAAADALSVIGDATSIDIVLGILASEPDWESQQRATAFLRAGLGDGGMFQRHAALRAALAIARRTRTPVAERVLAAIAKNPAKQHQLLEEFARLAGRPWESRARGQSQRAVQEALSNSSGEVVTAAVRAATAHRFDELAPEVVAMLAHPQLYSVRGLTQTWREFVQKGGARAIQEVAHVVEAAIRADATATAAKCAARAIALLEDFPAFGREHTALLVRALATSYSELRDAAERSLGRLGTREAADALLETAGTASQATALRAVRVLIKLKEPRVVQVALRLLAPFLAGSPITTYDEACLCENCIHALQAIGGADALDGLRRCLDHADRRMRRDAADALGAMGEPSVIAWLEPLVHDKDSQVRAAAKKAIAGLREASTR